MWFKFCKVTWSQPLITWPAPTWNWQGCPRSTLKQEIEFKLSKYNTCFWRVLFFTSSQTWFRRGEFRCSASRGCLHSLIWKCIRQVRKRPQLWARRHHHNGRNRRVGKKRLTRQKQTSFCVCRKTSKMGRRKTCTDTQPLIKTEKFPTQTDTLCSCCVSLF